MLRSPQRAHLEGQLKRWLSASPRPRLLPRRPRRARSSIASSPSGVIRCGGVPRPGLVSRSRRRRALRPLSRPLPRDRRGAAWARRQDRVPPLSIPTRRSRASLTAPTICSSSTDRTSPIIASPALRRSGPAVYFVATAAMVHGDLAPLQQLNDLAGKSICFYQGDSAHLNLEASMAARLSILSAWADGIRRVARRLQPRVCEAQVGESGDLVTARLEEHSRPSSRIRPSRSRFSRCSR